MAIGLCPLVRDLTVAIILHLQPAFDFKSHATIRALHDPNQPTAITVMLWFGAAVVAPTAEELFFRGILQTWFATALRSRWLAIAVTSIAFGGVHLAQVHAVAALAALAVLLGYIYERTGSLATVVLIHGLFNLKSLAWDALSNAPVTPYGV